MRYRRVARVQVRCASFFRRPSIGFCLPTPCSRPRWAYVASRIHADYVQTLEAERNSLRGVGATLRSATLAMRDDGVGAAVAGANELQSVGGIARASSAELSSTLQKQLTGGDYVRFLFLADNGRFAQQQQGHRQSAEHQRQDGRDASQQCNAKNGI
jgi:hypothetical protein